MAQQGRPQPGPAVRRDRDGDLRLRPRPLPERAHAGGPAGRLAAGDRRPRPRLAGDAVQPAAARAAHVQRRVRGRRARRAAGRGRRRGGRCSGARRSPSPPSWPCSKPCSWARRSCCTGSSCAGPASCSCVTTWLAATVGLAAVGTLYGGLAAGARGRETLLPLLLLPVVAPVLIGATRAVEAALGTAGTDIAEGWPWVGVVAVFAVAFGAGGTLAFGPLVDE